MFARVDADPLHIEGGEFPILVEDPPRSHGERHGAGMGGVDDGGGGIVAGHDGDVIGVDQHDIRPPARLEPAGFAFPADRAGAVLGGHADDLARRQCVGTQTDFLDQPRQLPLYRDRGIAWGSIGNVHMQRETWSEARTAYLEALVVRSVLHETDPSNLRWAQDLYFAYANLGVIEGHLGNRSAALDWSRKALALLETMLAKNPDNPRWKADADTLREQIAKLQQEGAEP